MGAGVWTHVGGVSTFSSPLILFASHFLGVKENSLNCESFFVSLRFLFESGSRRRGFLENVFMSLWRWSRRPSSENFMLIAQCFLISGSPSESAITQIVFLVMFKGIGSL